jgi:magnesium-transporting ATPase (P-type)
MKLFCATGAFAFAYLVFDDDRNWLSFILQIGFILGVVARVYTYSLMEYKERDGKSTWEIQWNRFYWTFAVQIAVFIYIVYFMYILQNKFPDRLDNTFFMFGVISFVTLTLVFEYNERFSVIIGFLLFAGSLQAQSLNDCVQYKPVIIKQYVYEPCDIESWNTKPAKIYVVQVLHLTLQAGKNYKAAPDIMSYHYDNGYDFFYMQLFTDYNMAVKCRDWLRTRYCEPFITQFPNSRLIGYD